MRLLYGILDGAFLYVSYTPSSSAYRSYHLLDTLIPLISFLTFVSGVWVARTWLVVKQSPHTCLFVHDIFLVSLIDGIGCMWRWFF